MYWLLLPLDANAQRHLDRSEVPLHVRLSHSIRAALARLDAYFAGR